MVEQKNQLKVKIENMGSGIAFVSALAWQSSTTWEVASVLL